MDIKTLQVFLGLSLATACTALVRESDVIWFPVDDEDGVFVSSYGEKYRTNWNSRKARFSDDYDSPRMSKKLQNFDEIRELLSNPRDPRLNEIPLRSTIRPKFMTSKSRRNVRVSSMNDFQNEEVVPVVGRYRLFLNKNRPTERPTKFIQIPYRRPNRKNEQDLISEIFDVHRTTTESYERDQNWPVRPGRPSQKPSDENTENEYWPPVRPGRPSERPSDQNSENQNWPPVRPGRPSKRPSEENPENQNWPTGPGNRPPQRPSDENSENQNWPLRPGRPSERPSDQNPENQNWPLLRPGRPSERPSNENSENQNWPTGPGNQPPQRPTKDNPGWDQNWQVRPNPPSRRPINSEWNQNWPNDQSSSNENSEWNQNWPRPNNPPPQRPPTDDFEWNQNRPNKPSPFPEVKPVTEETWEERPSTEPDKVIFPDDEEEEESGSGVTTESPFQPQTTTQSDCERSCQVTPEFNPVCGSDFTNYSNIGRLKCAQMCGKRVQFVHHGNCGRSREIRPPAQRTDPALGWTQEKK